MWWYLMRGSSVSAPSESGAMKVGIVVPYSWSYWGGVGEHVELKVEALRKLGIETRTIIGHDPPGSFTRVLHPRHGRHGRPPPDVIPVGRSVIVPANGALPNVVLSPSAPRRSSASLAARALRRPPPARADDAGALHVARFVTREVPVVATFHAHGNLAWNVFGKPVWGFLIDRIDHRIAVTEAARESAARWFPGEYELIPNGVLIPPEADPADRENRIVFVGRHDPRKGMPVLLRAWPEIHRRTGARLRVVGADPLMVRLALPGLGVDAEGIDPLGFLDQDALTDELLAAKALVAPSLGGESFGMVLTRAFACATPVVASDIDGYRDVMTDETGVLVPPGDSAALAEAVTSLLADEPQRERSGAAARSWRSSATPGTTSRDGWRRSTSGWREPPEADRAVAVDAGRSSSSSPPVALAALVWWRGPDWHQVGHAFDKVQWEYVFAAIGLNLLSVVVRAAAWRTIINQAMDEPHPSYPLVFSAFSVGLFANAVLPGRIGELARVAVLTRKLRLQGGETEPGRRWSAPSSRTGSSTSCRRSG